MCFFFYDLLIFSNGDLHSVVGTQKVLKEFYKYSGLMLNTSKNEIYYSRVSEYELQLMNDVSGFKVGKLPVKYLGVPLLTKKPSERDFDPLVQKMRAKVES